MKTNLKKAFLTTLAMLGVMLVLGNSKTWAADMCFLDDLNSTFVAKSFSFPAAGACKEVNGYELGTGCIISGTACGTSDNGVIRFNLSATCPYSNYYGSSSFSISRANSSIYQAGYGHACAPNVTNGSWVCTNWHINTITCPSPRPLY